MTQMRVAAMNGVVLTYDTDDVEKIEFSTPNDVIDITKPEDTAIRRKLGQAHLTLSVDFKEGKRPLWIEQADAALPELRAQGRTLRAILDVEGVTSETAQRIFNRLFFGHPDGIDAPPTLPDQVDAMRAEFDQALARVDSGWRVPHLPAGQTAGERFAAITQAAGCGPVPGRVEVTFEQLREQQRADVLDAYEIPESLRAAWRQIDEEA